MSGRDQNDGMPLALLSTMLRSPHCTALFFCHPRLMKLNTVSSGVGFQFLDLYHGVAFKDAPYGQTETLNHL